MAHSTLQKARDHESTRPDGLFYDTSVEIFIALRDVDYTYYLDDTKRVVPCRRFVDRFVRVYTQPVGALRDVEKCKTEVLYRTNGTNDPAFVTKVNLNFDLQDLSAQFLNCKVSYWDAVKVSVQRILQAGPKGLDIPLKLKFEYNQTDVHNKYTDFECSEVVPGRLFLRAEILQPITTGVVLQFGLTKSRDGSSKNCFLEFCKLNEGSLFDPATAFPYTPIHRTETRATGPKDVLWNPKFFFANTVCNEDVHRVLKIEIHKANYKAGKTQFALTTLDHILKGRSLSLPISSSVNGTLQKSNELIIQLLKEVQLNSFEYYIKKKLRLRRIYAVDFSNSNWKVNVNKFNLHAPLEDGSTFYEGALDMVASATHPNSESSGDAVFFGFGNPKMEEFIATFPYPGHVKSLICTYREALMNCKMAEASIKSNNLPGIPRGQKGSSPFACFPAPCNPLLGLGLKGTRLVPLLKSLKALLLSQSSSFHYNTVYIFSDGQITDVGNSLEIISQLSSLPVSLIFIGIGSGDFGPLQELEESAMRSIVHLVYFRSYLEWNSAVKSAKYASAPFQILQKEIFTSVRDDCLGYLRLYRPEI